MKNILAENLLRFGVKNLKESDKQKLMEQDPKAGKMTPEQAKAFDDYIAKSQQAVKNAFGTAKEMILLPMKAPAGPGNVEFFDVQLSKWESATNHGLYIKLLVYNTPSADLVSGGTPKYVLIPLVMDDAGTVKFGGAAKFNMDLAGLEGALSREGYKNLITYADKANPEYTKGITRILDGCKTVASMYQKSGVGTI